MLAIAAECVAVALIASSIIIWLKSSVALCAARLILSFNANGTVLCWPALFAIWSIFCAETFIAFTIVELVSEIAKSA